MSTETPELVDADVVDDTPGTDLEQVDVQPPSNLFRTDDPAEVVERATNVANVLKDVLRQQGLISNIQGRDHVRVEGFQLVGAMLGITAVCTHTVAVDDGFKATVEARTADGRVVGAADALCTRKERSWKSRDDYALLSMAQTRATSKALRGPLGFVVSLAGYATTPAEEMTFAEPEQAAPARESDVPVEDVWLTQTMVRLKALKLDGAAIREGLTAIGVEPDPKAKSTKAALGGLPEDKRLVFSEWLSERETAGTPLEAGA